VILTAAETGIRCKALGETTWKRPEIARGLEADQCYYFQPAKIEEFTRVRGQNSIALMPNPDLAVEVDISPPEVDRPGIYAALEVAEIWRFADRRIIIERLTPAGAYVQVDRSGFLPVTAAEIQRWIVDEDRADDDAWFRRIQAELKARFAPKS
jgi:Uma2 family endonuclease